MADFLRAGTSFMYSRLQSQLRRRREPGVTESVSNEIGREGQNKGQTNRGEINSRPWLRLSLKL
ncbi:MAG: hypothetical protein M3362_10630 [Acidobacteriota bacterium]|nr:hypothetical protein [Acidobacteriota bacterium]